MTGEQRSAFETFQSAVAPLRLRVKADAEGFPIAPGRYGQLEWHDARQVAIHSQTMRMLAKLLKIAESAGTRWATTSFGCLWPSITCTTGPQLGRSRGCCGSGHGGSCPNARN
jgi:hypothetical protein